MSNESQVLLGSVASFINGDRGKNYPSQQERVRVGIPFVNAADLIDGRIVFESAETISQKVFARLSRGKTDIGDLLVCLRGTPGRLARNTSGRAAIASSLVILRPEPDVSGRYLFYVLSGPVMQSKIHELNNGSAQPNVSATALKSIKVRLPPLFEQNAVADILGSLDDKIELNRQMNRTLEAMARVIFKAWFVDFEPVKAKAAGATSFRGMPQAVFDQLPDSFTDTEMGPVPTGWKHMPIGDLVNVVGGGTPRTKNPEFWEGGKYAFCTPKDLSRLSAPVLLDTERHITQLGVDKISSGQLPVGTVILSSRAPIGYLALAETPTSVNQGIIAMVTGEIPNTYILLWTKANMEVIKSRAGGSTFAEISKKNFRPIPALKPDETTLRGFGDCVKALFERIASNERESQTLVAIRDALLPKLVSGELRVEPRECSSAEAVCR